MGLASLRLKKKREHFLTRGQRASSNLSSNSRFAVHIYVKFYVFLIEYPTAPLSLCDLRGLRSAPRAPPCAVRPANHACADTTTPPPHHPTTPPPVSPCRRVAMFSWQHDELSKSKDFRGLVEACGEIVGTGTA